MCLIHIFQQSKLATKCKLKKSKNNRKIVTTRGTKVRAQAKIEAKSKFYQTKRIKEGSFLGCKA